MNEYGGLILTPEKGYNPSSVLADAWGPMTFDEQLDDEGRRKVANAFIEMWDLIERLGWYEHTSDWDFHVEVELITGEKNDHIGDGATVQWKGEAANGEIALQDTRDTLVITGPLYHDDETDERETDQLKAYRTITPGGDPSESGEAVWEIPINKLKSLTFGFCR